MSAPAAPSEDLSAIECVQLLSQLLTQYQHPPFQQELKALHADPRAGADFSGWLRSMAALVLRVQAPLLLQHRLTADSAGVDMMKHSVLRRICENSSHSDQIEQLANDARVSLGFAPMTLLPRDARCEHTLISMLDRKATPSYQQLKERAATLLVEGAVTAAANQLIRSRITERMEPNAIGGLISMAAVKLPTTLLSGQQQQPTDVPVLDWAALGMTSRAFFTEFVLPSTPCVIKRLLDEDTFPPLKLFPDFSYLRAVCGHRRALVKSMAVRDEKDRAVFVSDPELKMRLVDFLELVEAAEARDERCLFYLGKRAQQDGVSVVPIELNRLFHSWRCMTVLSQVTLRNNLPELNACAMEAPQSPISLLGDCFGPLIPTGLVTYFGVQHQITPTHNDLYENLLVTITGTKKLWLFPPHHAAFLYPIGGAGPNSGHSRSAVPPFQHFDDWSSDMKQTFPAYADAVPLEVNLVAGDVLYLPAGWWHCVQGGKDRNMILNYWFSIHLDKQSLDATNSRLGADRPFTTAPGIQQNQQLECSCGAVFATPIAKRCHILECNHPNKK